MRERSSGIADRWPSVGGLVLVLAVCGGSAAARTSAPLPPLPGRGVARPRPPPTAAPGDRRRRPRRRRLADASAVRRTAGDAAADGPEPGVLRRPIEPAARDAGAQPGPPAAELPGRSGGPRSTRRSATPGRRACCPSEGQHDPHFVPVEDRWRIGYPEWDRYGKGHPINDDYPYMPGRLLDPFNQNVLKGDFPIIGQHTFLDVTASVISFQEYRQIPTADDAVREHRAARRAELLRPPEPVLHHQLLHASRST